jgi:hypothetical protein
MTYLIDSGIQISIDGTTWYKLTDHNREPIDISTELIETQSRMANGTMRKYVVAQKNNISCSWKYVPSSQSECVDGFYSAAWLESFYKSNAGLPIYLKVVSSGLNTDSGFGSQPLGIFVTAQNRSKTYEVFMNDFSKTIINRTKVSDYVDMSIEFVER